MTDNGGRLNWAATRLLLAFSYVLVKVLLSVVLNKLLQ